MKHEEASKLSNYKSIDELMKKVGNLNAKDRYQIRRALGQVVGIQHKKQMHLKKYLKTEDKSNPADLKQRITHCIQKYYTEVVTGHLV